MEFDENGFLKPYQPILADLDTFEAYFVKFKHRKDIFESYLAFIEDIKKLPIGNFQHWLNGSFTTKKLQPNDLDILMFVETKVFYDIENQLFDLKEKYKRQALDIYFIIKRDENDIDYFHYQSDYANWYDLFSKTRARKGSNTRLKKGFIQINFNFDEK